MRAGWTRRKPAEQLWHVDHVALEPDLAEGCAAPLRNALHDHVRVAGADVRVVARLGERRSCGVTFEVGLAVLGHVGHVHHVDPEQLAVGQTYGKAAQPACRVRFEQVDVHGLGQHLVRGPFSRTG